MIYSKYTGNVGIQEKKQRGDGGEEGELMTYFFENPLEFLFTLKNSAKLCYTPQKF